MQVRKVCWAVALADGPSVALGHGGKPGKAGRAPPRERLWTGGVGRLTDTGVVDKGLRRDQTKSELLSQPPLWAPNYLYDD